MAAWNPNRPGEAAYYDKLFQFASQGSAEVSGQQAVEFFGHAGVDVTYLRDVWNVACRPNAMTLNKSDFCVAMRLLAMAQAGMAVSNDALVASANASIPMVRFGFDGAPQPPQEALPAQQQPSSVESSAAASTVDPAKYAMTKKQLAKYVALFAQYDADSDGYLTGTEAKAVLLRSGLPEHQLSAVWMLADVGRDGRLDEHEFAIAFHIILCVTKRGMPIPPTLPDALQLDRLGQTPARSQPAQDLSWRWQGLRRRLPHHQVGGVEAVAS